VRLWGAPVERVKLIHRQMCVTVNANYGSISALARINGPTPLKSLATMGCLTG